MICWPGAADAALSRYCLMYSASLGTTSSSATCTLGSWPLNVMPRSFGSCPGWGTGSGPLAWSILTTAPDCWRIWAMTEPALPMIEPHESERTSMRTLYPVESHTAGLFAQDFCISARM